MVQSGHEFVNSAPDALINEVATLRAMLVEAWAERDAIRAERKQLATQNPIASRDPSAAAHAVQPAFGEGRPRSVQS